VQKGGRGEDRVRASGKILVAGGSEKAQPGECFTIIAFLAGERQVRMLGVGLIRVIGGRGDDIVVLGWTATSNDKERRPNHQSQATRTLDYRGGDDTERLQGT